MNRQDQVDDWGRFVMNDDDLREVLLRGGDITKDVVAEDSSEVRAFNSTCILFDKAFAVQTVDDVGIEPHLYHTERAGRWNIPDEYAEMDIVQYLVDRCPDHGLSRLEQELDLYRERDLFPVLRLMVFLVDRFREQKIVWGVGRGSSVASYVLYLIGVHMVDSIKYDLSITEFLR